MQVQPVDLRVIDKEAANVYEAIIVCGKRSRQITDENKLEFNALISTIPTSGSDEDGEDIENPAQMKISLEMEKKPKPHVAALYELLDGKVDFDYKP